MLKSRRSKIAAILMTVLAVILIGAIIVVKTVLPGKLKAKILLAVNDSCSDCSMQIKSLEIGLAPLGQITFHDVRVQAGQGGVSMVEARINELVVTPSLHDCSREKLVFDEVEASDVSVIYSEGDAKKIARPEKPSASAMDFVVEHTTLTRGTFRYAHTQNHKTAILHIHAINGTLGTIGTPKEIQDQMAEVHLAGQLETSGHADLTVAALTRPGPHYVDVVFKLENQNLDDANIFFTPNDGLTFHGDLIEALAKVQVRDQKAKTDVRAIYKNAELKAAPTSKISPVEAFFTNLGAALVMTKSNVDHLENDQSTQLEVDRYKDEALVHFILRSVKESLLDIAKKKDSRKIQASTKAAIKKPLGKE